jgi:hypothetical protein
MTWKRPADLQQANIQEKQKNIQRAAAETGFEQNVYNHEKWPWKSSV